MSVGFQVTFLNNFILLVLIDVDSVENDSTQITNHFNIFEDLFGQGAYFYNVQGANVDYGEGSSVRFGNVINSWLSTQKPNVSIESGKDGFTSLLMLNLEGGISEQTAEDAVIGIPQIIQWLVSNIEDGNDVSSGEQAVPYLQPIPFYGTGFHRIAFLFFRHNRRIDVDSFFKLKRFVFV
jgi:large subunit ribosomal protein L38